MEVDEIVTVFDRKQGLRDLSHWCLWIESRYPLRPDEAFAQKNMPDLGHDVEDFKVYTWRLNKWKTLEKKLTSPEFECGGHRWYGAAQSSLPLLTN